jgi:murein DD-endopeptidase MepM/ murein hydrolase activator NlpD
MPKVKYYYDAETFKFEKVTLDKPTLLRSIITYLLVSSSVAVLVVLYLFYFASNPHTELMRQENADLAIELEKFEETLGGLEADLGSLHRKDEDAYRSILKAEPIQEEQEEGLGLSAGFKPFEKKSLLETDERVEALDAKVKAQRDAFKRLLAIYSTKEEEMQHVPSIRPIPTDCISGFGERFHPILKVRKSHPGIDFGAPKGSPVYATADGVVVSISDAAYGYGLAVDILHGSGYETKYAHLSQVKVQPGQKVKRGEWIALTGNSGLSKGPHLHYEIKINGEKVDPVDYFYSDLSPEQYVIFKRQANQVNESMD